MARALCQDGRSQFTRTVTLTHLTLAESARQSNCCFAEGSVTDYSLRSTRVGAGIRHRIRNTCGHASEAQATAADPKTRP